MKVFVYATCANCANTMPIASIVAVPIPCANTLYLRYRSIGIGTVGSIAQPVCQLAQVEIYIRYGAYQYAVYPTKESLGRTVESRFGDITSTFYAKPKK